MSNNSENNEKDSKEPDNPFQIALRTYLLSLSLSLGPSILPLLVSQTSARLYKRHPSAFFRSLNRILNRELALDGFAFSLTLAVAGGALLKRYWRTWTVWKDLLDELCNVVDGSDPHSVVENNRGNSNSDITVSLFAKVKAWFARNITPEQGTLISYVISSSIGVSLLQAGIQRNRAMHPRPGPSSKRSPTLDLTLLLLVRAVDSLVQSFIIQRSSFFPLALFTNKADKGKAKEQVTTNKATRSDSGGMEQSRRGEEFRQHLASHLDAVVFWACSARIMWCFFYEPHKLPKTYVTWIQKLANLDPRIVQTLRFRSIDKWTYQPESSSNSSILEETYKDLGYPPSWGNPSVVPGYGGKMATELWKKLGVKGRDGVGGVPCEVLHYLPSIFGKAGEDILGTELKRSCVANAVLRMGKGFLDAMAIYLPVHFLPFLLTNPKAFLRPHRLLETLLGSLRSSTFLSSFIALFWFSVCLTRTLVLAKLLPFISHNFWDGPFGGIMAGCLTCGCSIWIENGRRRGEMALYVLPKAIRTCFPNGWVTRGDRWGFRIIERTTFVLSLATLLTAATHRPESLRGLSRWALAFIMNGPNAGFWKRRRRDPSIPPTLIRQNGIPSSTARGSQDVDQIVDHKS